MNNTHFTYRPDIDGLRAVAVILVLLYHVSPAKYPSGFIGVDVFFVISGYLISSIILGELRKEKFSIKNFYVKRAMRIFPSLFIVMISTLGLGVLILNPIELKSLLKHMGAGSFFISNITLYIESGYFDSSSDYKPLLHFWSLSIEEQFYIFWPLLLALFFKRKWSINFLIFILIFVSFALNIYFVHSHPSATFYLIHTRTWELLVGAALAYQEFKNIKLNSFSSNTKSILGTILLSIAVILINEKSVFPGFWALLPIIGTSLLISAGKEGAINKHILSKKYIVFIGLLSYPLYLWHWPFLSFLRIVEIAEPSSHYKNIVIVLSFVFAYLTYRFVERPLREKVPTTKKNLLAGMLAVSIILFGVFSFLAMNKINLGFKGLNDPRDFEATELTNANCLKLFPRYQGDFCLLSHPLEPRIAIIGDSHAHSLYYGVKLNSKEPVLLLGHSACAPFYDTVSFPERGIKRCLNEINSAIDIVIKNPGIKKVILHFRANTYTEVSNFSQAFDKTIKKLLLAEKEVLFIHQIPELHFSPKTCVDLHRFRLSPKNTACSVNKKQVVNDQALYRKKMIEVTSRMLIFDPLNVMCNDKSCFAKRAEEILYRDNNHLNKNGSRYLIERLNIMDFIYTEQR